MQNSIPSSSSSSDATVTTERKIYRLDTILNENEAQRQKKGNSRQTELRKEKLEIVHLQKRSKSRYFITRIRKFCL